jgi:Rrf2 family protein
MTGKFYEGLEAVVFIALNSGAGPVSSKAVCAAQGVLSRHLEPVMQLLVHNGILRGTKGPKGGYSLAKEKRKITAGEIFRLFANHDLSTQDTILKKKVIIPLNKMAEDAALQIFDTVTIEDLCKKAVLLGDSGKVSDNFNI